MVSFPGVEIKRSLFIVHTHLSDDKIQTVLSDRVLSSDRKQTLLSLPFDSVYFNSDVLAISQRPLNRKNSTTSHHKSHFPSSQFVAVCPVLSFSVIQIKRSYILICVPVPFFFFLICSVQFLHGDIMSAQEPYWYDTWSETMKAEAIFPHFLLPVFQQLSPSQRVCLNVISSDERNVL